MMSCLLWENNRKVFCQLLEQTVEELRGLSPRRAAPELRWRSRSNRSRRAAAGCFSPGGVLTLDVADPAPQILFDSIGGAPPEIRARRARASRRGDHKRSIVRL